MKLSILYTLQPSVNNGEHWVIMADSNTNMMRGFVSEIMKKEDVEFCVIGPDINQTELVEQKEIFHGLGEHIDEAFISGRLKYIPVSGRPIDAVSYRYEFDMGRDLEAVQAWHERSGAEHLVFWNNIPELTANYMNYFHHPKNDAKDVVFVNCCYFLDSPIHPKTGVDEPIHHKAVNWWRQVEGALRADIAGFCCDGNRHQFFEGVNYSHHEDIVQAITKNAWVFRFGYSETELDTLVDEAPHVADICTEATKGGKFLITFPNRISDPDYTNGLLFIEAMEMLSHTRDDFVWTVTNPGQKYVKNVDLAEKYDNFVLISENDLTRAEYVTLLGNTDFHCSLFIEEANGGCACREAMHLGSMPIIPFANEYTNLARADWPGYFNVPNGKLDVIKLMEHVNNCLNEGSVWTREFVKETQKQYEFNHEYGSFRVSTQEVLRAFKQHGIHLD